MNDLDLIHDALVDYDQTMLTSGDDDVMAAFDRVKHALTMADGSLTWCQARHQGMREPGPPDAALDEAVRLVLAITRLR